MANIDIKINEDNLVEKDGVLYRKDENGLLVKTGYDTLIIGFENTDIYRAQNIVQLRRDKYFNDSGIDIDSVFNSFLAGAAGVILSHLVVEELQRLQVDIKDIITTDKDFVKNLVISLAE